MSDYLSLLAGRLSGAAPTVQPRLPARFEPPARPLNLEGALSGLYEEWVEEAAPAPAGLPVQPAQALLAHTQLTPSLPLDGQIPASQKSDRSLSRVEPASQPAPRPLPGPTMNGVTARPAAEAPEAPRLTPLQAPAAHPVKKTEAPAPILRPAPEDRRSEALPPEGPAIEVQVTRAALPVNRREAAVLQALKNPVTTQAQPASSQLSHLQPAVSPSMTAVPPASARAASARRGGLETSPSLSPTIQVTIGRIEVHAAPAPAVTGPRKSRSAPLMSLEEYLKQRPGEKG